MDKESSRSNFWSKKTFVLVKIMNDMEFVDRNILGICKDHLNYITMADCKHFRGDAIDLETFSGNIISGIVFTKRRKLLIFKFTECEKTEETLMTSWYPAVTAVFNDKTITKVWYFLSDRSRGWTNSWLSAEFTGISFLDHRPHHHQHHHHHHHHQVSQSEVISASNYEGSEGRETPQLL